MDFKILLPDSSRETADIAVDVIGDNKELFAQLMDFIFNNTGQLVNRATRVAVYAADNYPELIEPYLNTVIELLSDVKHEAVKRGFLKFFTTHTLPDVEDDRTAVLINHCFDWLIAPSEAIAVKVYAMEILYRISNLLPDLKQELIYAIEDQIPKGTPAIKAVGEKLLRKLYKEVA